MGAGSSTRRVVSAIETLLMQSLSMSNHILYSTLQTAIKNPQADEPLTDIETPGIQQTEYSFPDVKFVELNLVKKKHSLVVVYFGGVGTTLNQSRDVILCLINKAYSLGINIRALTYDHMAEPTMSSVLKDGLNMCKWGLRDGGNLVIISHSLGTGFASQVAFACENQKLPLKHLVLCSPYTTLAQSQSWKRKWISDKLVEYTLGADLRTICIFPLLNTKATIIVGENDDVIRAEEGEKIYNSRPENTAFINIPGGDHGSTYRLCFKQNYLKTFLDV